MVEELAPSVSDGVGVELGEADKVDEDVVLVVVGTTLQHDGTPAQLQVPRIGAAYPRSPGDHVFAERFSTVTSTEDGPLLRMTYIRPIAPGATVTIDCTMASVHEASEQLLTGTVE